MLTPYPNLLILQGTIVDGDQRIAAIKLAIMIWVVCYLGIEIKQIAKLRNKISVLPTQ